MAFKLKILGSNSAAPTSTRNSSSQLLDTTKHLFLLDCAEGTQMQLRKYKIRFQKINHIFITHLHGDHFFGLIGLLTTFHLLGRDKPLHLYAVPALKEALDVLLKVSQTTLIYPLEYHFIDPEKNRIIFEDNFIEVSTLPLLHRIPCCGFLFREKPAMRKINKAAIADLRIPIEAFSFFQKGEDFITAEGKQLKFADYTTVAPEPISYAYCTDTGYYEPLIERLKEVQYLFHESTFMESEAMMALEKQHSTAREAASIASQAGVKMLILGHFSARYKELESLLSEATAVFPHTVLAEDGMEFILDNKL